MGVELSFNSLDYLANDPILDTDYRLNDNKSETLLLNWWLAEEFLYGKFNVRRVAGRNVI